MKDRSSLARRRRDPASSPRCARLVTRGGPGAAPPSRFGAPVVAAALALATSCTPATVHVEDATSRSVPFETVLATTQACGGGEASAVVLTAPEDFLAWWQDATCGGRGSPPSLDFASRIVVAVRGPVSPNGCYGAAIEDVRETVAGGYEVIVVRRVPRPAQACVVGSSLPAQAVVVPAARGTVAFTWRTAQGPAS